jgi:exodeoxyribonuclease V gamma subunit
MTLHVHRSQHVETLVDALHEQLKETRPADPFAAVPLVVGSRGMERWLRHELATRADSACRLEFLFPRGAFESAADGLLAPDAKADTPLFRARRRNDDAWSGTRLVQRTLTALRTHLDEPSFAAVRDYVEIAPNGIATFRAKPVGAREARFAAEVASVIERLHYDRPDDALLWARTPDDAPEAHRWIATLLHALESPTTPAERESDGASGAVTPPPHGVGPSPAALLRALEKATPRTGASRAGEVLHVFGLSTLRPGDQRRLRALAAHTDVHLYLLTPSAEWWVDLPTHREQLRELRKLRSKLAAEGPAKLKDTELASLFSTNALLAANGLPSRDVQLWLEQGDYEEGLPGKPPKKTSLLAHVQAWVNLAAETPTLDAPPWGAFADCESIEVHACHGALRQCEALRDELLRRFAADRTLEPRHVLVMTPDVTTYAPLLAAVFGRKGVAPAGDARQDSDAKDRHTASREREIPAIPVHIADLGLRATNAVADALLRVLALGQERVTASALLELLELWPVRARFGLEEAELPELRELVRQSGMRWAWDAQDRSAHAQPRRDQNTVRFGLERLALGALMPDDDEDGLGALDAGTATVTPAHGRSADEENPILIGTLQGTRPASEGPSEFGPAAPLELGTRERLAKFGALAALCDTVASFCATRGDTTAVFATPATGPEWRTRLIACVDALTKVEDASAWLRAQVVEVLDERLKDIVGDADGTSLQFDRAAVVALIGDAFEMPTKGDRPVTGAVTVCAMEPMRSVPFRIIAMLGLDGGEFPRRSKAAAWDPFAKPCSGEHDRGALDRHLFLESLLCAREAFLLFGTGFEPKRGAEEPLSVVATELEELVLRGVGRTLEDAKKSSWPRRRHPLQPWSERAFRVDSLEGSGAATAARLPFDPVWFEARRALATGLSAPPIVLDKGAWPAESELPKQLRADELARALENAPRSLLKERLGLSTRYDDDDPGDREPLDVDSLDKFKVRQVVLDALLEGPEAPRDLVAEAADRDPVLSRIHERLRATGELPLAAGGDALLASLVAESRALRAEAEGTLRRVETKSVKIDEVTLTAHVPFQLQGGVGDALAWFTARANPNEHDLLAAWLSLMVIRASGDPTQVAVVFARSGTLWLKDAADIDAASTRLRDLLAMWRRTRNEVLPLFPAFSPALASDKDSPLPLLDLLEKHRSAWEGAHKTKGALDDRWVTMLVGDLALEELESFEELREVANAVWGSAIDAKTNVTRLKADAKAASGTTTEPTEATSAPKKTRKSKGAAS